MKTTISHCKSSDSKGITFGITALSGLISCLFLLAGCFTGLETPRPGEGTGLVRIVVGGNQRTLLPDLPDLESLCYTLVLSAENQQDVSAFIPAGNTDVAVELVPATWTIRARGFVSQADAEDPSRALVQGTASVTVTAGATESLQIPLSLQKTQSGTGILRYEASAIEELGLDADTDTAYLLIQGLSDGASPSRLISLLQEASGDISLNAGYYRLSVSLSKYSADVNRSMRAGKTEVVHIYDSLTTRWEDAVDGYYSFYTLPDFANAADLLNDIDEAPATTSATNPYYVALRGAYTAADLNTLFSDIQSKATYITLDLADCEIESITTSLTNPAYVVSLILPKSLKTLGGSSLSSQTFRNWTQLKAVAFPPASALETLNRYTFYQCTGLVSADLSNCVALQSNEWTFYGCTALEEAKLPESLGTLGDYAFRGCTNLKSVNIPVSLKAIGNFAFYECQSLVSAKLPASLETIGNSAFYNCQTLASLTLSASLRSIGNNAFQGCKALTFIELPASLRSIGSNAFGNSTAGNACQNLDVDFSRCRSLITIGENAFRNCAITTVDLSGCIRLLNTGLNAFADNEKLASVKLPAILDTITSGTFNNCPELVECVVYATEPPIASADVFSTANAELQIRAPADSVEAYKTAAVWSAWADRIVPMEE